MLMLALASIGLLTGFYFYFYPRNDKGLAYTVEGPSIIYDSKVASPSIRLVDSSNSPVVFDTYLQTFTIWNTGSSAIEPADVRRPISFIFPGSERILDTRIIASTDPDICEFKVSDKNPESTNGVFVTWTQGPASGSQKPVYPAVFLTWKHFDPKKAVKFQVIYCQQSKPVTLVSAEIVGISKLQAGAKQKAWPDAVMMAFSTLLTTFIMASIIRDAVRSKSPRRWIKILIASLVGLTLVVTFWEFLSQKIFLPTPPL